MKPSFRIMNSFSMILLLAVSSMGQKSSQNATVLQRRLWASAEKGYIRPTSAKGKQLDIDSTSEKVPELDWRVMPLSAVPLVFQWEKMVRPRFHKMFIDMLNRMGNTSTDPETVAEATRLGRYQDRIPDSVPFPCDIRNGRSPIRPDKVNLIRPGDIDIVAALGDSITAGNNIAGTKKSHERITNRGLSGLIGGQGTWRQYITLPNLLKEFNPNLTGYSLGDSLFNAQSYNVQLNLAEPATFMLDLPDMAKSLYKKMSSDSRYDMKNDWKMISILSGNVDFCLDICFWKHPYEAVASAERSFRKTLDYIMENFPRTIVVLVVNLDIPKLVKTFKYPENSCKSSMIHHCPCVFGKSFQTVQDKYEKLASDILDVQTKVGSDEKYKKKDDFRIIVENTMRYGAAMPEIMVNGTLQADMSYFSPDCFHISQKAQAWASRNLWNSLFSPKGKSPQFDTSPIAFPNDIECPTEDHPYINL